jgi:hypothetical protein
MTDMPEIRFSAERRCDLHNLGVTDEQIADVEAVLPSCIPLIESAPRLHSRPDIGGPAGTAGLPERLAMRERDLASDLGSLRQRKAIIETMARNPPTNMPPDTSLNVSPKRSSMGGSRAI